MLHTFNRLGNVQDIHPLDIKYETLEDLPPLSTCTFSDTHYHALLPFPITSRPHSPSGTRPRRTPFRFSSLRKAHSKGYTRRVSECRATMSHPFPSKGTPSRIVYASVTTPSRGSMDDNQRVIHSPSYALPGAFPQSHGRIDIRPQSPGSSMTPTSSLSGAVGEMDIPPQLRNSVTRPSYQTDSRTPSYWMPGAPNISAIAPNVQPNTHSSDPTNNPYDANPATDLGSAMHLNQPTTRPRSPSFTHSYTSQMSFQHVRSLQSSPVPMISRPGSQMSSHRFCDSPQHSIEEENRLLRNKVKELELVNEQRRQRIMELEGQLASYITDRPFPNSESSTSIIVPILSGATPSPHATPASWKARTDARTRYLCSLNRAGNALCSWHDSRRERRRFPPRMAPQGYLNCGCTFDEALFEESLSRHGVGSYHPGEAVRMDPALRNPLLKLLQERYGYRDGDFERDPLTGDWVDGEGSTLWEQKLLSGTYSSRKRSEDRR